MAADFMGQGVVFALVPDVGEGLQWRSVGHGGAGNMPLVYYLAVGFRPAKFVEKENSGIIQRLAYGGEIVEQGFPFLEYIKGKVKGPNNVNLWRPGGHDVSAQEGNTILCLSQAG